MGASNLVAFDTLERISIVRDDIIIHDINAGISTGAVKKGKQEEWRAFLLNGLDEYIKSNATDQSFLFLKAYLLSILFDLTGGLSLEKVWERFKCLQLPKDLEEKIVTLAIEFSPRGKDLYDYLIDLRRKENIRVAK